MSCEMKEPTGGVYARCRGIALQAQPNMYGSALLTSMFRFVGDRDRSLHSYCSTRRCLSIDDPESRVGCDYMRLAAAVGLLRPITR